MVNKLTSTVRSRRSAPVATGGHTGEAGDRKVLRRPRSLEALVAREMPGWKIDSDAELVVDDVEDHSMRSERGPSIAELRRKFLGDADAADNSPDAFAEVDRKVETVRIKPSGGGPAKVADVRNGNRTCLTAHIA